MKIYVDTNWFLNYYQTGGAPTHLLERLRAAKAGAIITHQTIVEFERNRENILRTLRENVKRSITVNPYTAAVLRPLPAFSKVVQAREGLEAAGRALMSDIDQLLQAPATDPVHRVFSSLRAHSRYIEIDDNIVRKAHVRKLRGIPPSSGKRDTIGDEIIWEALLQDCREDLAIVTNDSDFLLHKVMLQEEYRSATHGYILHDVTSDLDSVLTRFGDLAVSPQPPERQVDPETRCDCGAFDWETIVDAQGNPLLQEKETEDDPDLALMRCQSCNAVIAIP
jgi:hypothetical protein